MVPVAGQKEERIKRKDVRARTTKKKKSTKDSESPKKETDAQRNKRLEKGEKGKRGKGGARTKKRKTRDLGERKKGRTPSLVLHLHHPMYI